MGSGNVYFTLVFVLQVSVEYLFAYVELAYLTLNTILFVGNK